MLKELYCIFEAPYMY